MKSLIVIFLATIISTTTWAQNSFAVSINAGDSAILWRVLESEAFRSRMVATKKFLDPGAMFCSTEAGAYCFFAIGEEEIRGKAAYAIINIMIKNSVPHTVQAGHTVVELTDLTCLQSQGPTARTSCAAVPQLRKHFPRGHR
jgi:hypothetical protein